MAGGKGKRSKETKDKGTKANTTNANTSSKPLPLSVHEMDVIPPQKWNPITMGDMKEEEVMFCLAHYARDGLSKDLKSQMESKPEIRKQIAINVCAMFVYERHSLMSLHCICCDYDCIFRRVYSGRIP